MEYVLVLCCATPSHLSPAFPPVVGAQLLHLQKYLDKYTELYPNAQQIVVRSEHSLFFVQAKTRVGIYHNHPLIYCSSLVTQESSVLPAAEHLIKAMAQNPTPSLLVHVFSNGGFTIPPCQSLTDSQPPGGGLQLVELSRLLARKKVDPPSKPPVTCIILDSVPGRGGIRRSLEAFTISIKSRLLKFAAYAFLTGWMLLFQAIRSLRRKNDIITDLRLKINNPLILPWTTANTPRLYLYSDTDRLIPQEAVDEHIADAKTIGLNVRAELLLGSAHVTHARTYPERYWGAVKSAWAEAWKTASQ